MSSFFRNIGSALTFGAIETSRAKEARERYIERYGRHKERYEAYEEFVDTAIKRLEELRKQAQQAREVIIQVGALSIDDDGNVQVGWYPLEATTRSKGPDGGGKTAILGGAGTLTAGIGAPAAAWVAVGALGTASTGAAIGGLSGAAATSATAAWFGGGAAAAGGLGMAAAPFALTGIGLLAAAPMLGVGFWKSRQRERERLDAIRESTEKIERREAEMREHQSKLEAILPEISPAIEELASTATDTKSANDSRLASISVMRSTLATHCARMQEALHKTSSAVKDTQGNRQELRTISVLSDDLATAAAELQTESNRQEASVNQEIDRTMEKLNGLVAAVETADEILSKARAGGTDTSTKGLMDEGGSSGVRIGI